MVQKLTDQKILNTKFVLIQKRDENGAIQKYKACLEICGNEETNNYEECFSPVADNALIRLVITRSLQQRWTLRDLDFENAFPDEVLKRPVHLRLLKCIIQHGKYQTPNIKLKRSLYGLQDAAKV